MRLGDLLKIRSAGTPEGAKKGWESRVRSNKPLGQRGQERVAKEEEALMRKEQVDRILHRPGAKEHPGAVCGHCGRTVTNNEYSRGKSDCCEKGVVPEEQYGR